MASYEEPGYQVLQSYGNIEIRQYKKRIVAEVLVEGNRESALGEGFNLLAAYIFGKNKRKAKMPMTITALSNAKSTTTDESLYRSESIPMTAPVTASSTEANKWTIRFFMPIAYTLATLPIPDSERIKLSELAPQKFAVIKFSGFGSEKSFNKMSSQLHKFLTQQKISPGAEFNAYYNPPWTLPFFRRNEVMISID